MATSSGSVFWPGNDEDIEIAPSILKDLFRYLRDNLSIDNNLASELFGWKPLLLGSREHKRIRALNDQGKDDDAFQTWFSFATSAYTKENLVELCKCLRKAGKDAGQEKIICIAEKIEAAMESYRSDRSAGTEENKIMAGKWSLADRCLFMSHSSKDKDTVDEIVQALRQSGINVWYDKDEIRTGHQWDKKISEDMQHMYGFICCMSEDFLNSDICYKELQAFESAQQDNSAIPKDSIFPVVVDPSRFKRVKGSWRMALPTQTHYKKWTVDNDQQLFLKDMKDFVNGITQAVSGNPPGPSTSGIAQAVSGNPPGPSTSDVIKSTEDFLPYTSKLEPYLTQLGTVLGISDHALAIKESPGNPNSKVLKILKHWIDVTPGRTWKLFYDNLGKSHIFEDVRLQIRKKHNIPGKWSLADRCLFMSHSSKDKDTIDKIVQALRHFGINVWYDKDEIRTGHQWDTKISEDMKHMYGFICCMSEDFFDSDICYKELQAFMSAQKDNSAIPNDSIFPVIVVDPSLFKGVRASWRMALPTQIHYKKWTVDNDQQVFLKDLKDFVNGSTPTPSTSPPGPQPTTAWIAAYEEALEKQGSVSVGVTRCLFIGPPAVGKSSLKHLLIHNKSKAVKISTRVMESPDVVRVTSEQYAVEEGSSSWKLLDGKAMIQSVQKSALERKYQSVDDSITQEEHQSSESGVSDTQSTNIEKNRSISNTIDQLATTDTKPVMKNEKVSKLEEAFAGMFKEISLKDGITLNNASFIHLLDSGGQPCFLDILPLLLTVPCTYILVFNASQDLNQPLLVKYRADKDSEKILPSSQTGQDLIRRMMSSFHTMAAKHSKKMSQFQEHGAQSPQLRIHLIGTFKDVLQQSGRLEDQSKSVTDAIQSLSILPSFNRIIKDPQGRLFHLINNNLTDDPKCSSEELEYIGCLRSSLSQSGSALTLDVPLMWYLLQQVIHTAGEKLMRYTELRDFAMKYQLNNHPMVVSKQHFASFVELFTVLGFFVYFSFPATPDESKWVCTDATFFYREVSKLLSIQFTKVCKSETIHFKKTGSISLSPSFVLEELQISKAMDPEWLFKALVHTGIAADSDGKCQELFIPAALPSQDHPPYTTSLSVVCASFKFQKGVFLLEYINLPQGLYCRVIVELANFKKGLWKLVPEESTRTSVKFLWRNGQILLMESEDRLEIAVTFYEPFLSPKCTPCKVMDKVHNYCSGVLADVEMSMKKVADDMFGKQNPDIGDVVVGFRCPCGGTMSHLAIVVDDDNPSMRCVGGKMTDRFQNLSLDQMIWFTPHLPNEVEFTLQHCGDLKFFKLCNQSTPSPSQNGITQAGSDNPPGPSTSGSSSSTGTDAVSNPRGSHTTIHGGVHYNIGSVTDSSMSPGSHHHNTGGSNPGRKRSPQQLSSSAKKSQPGIAQAVSGNPPGPSTSEGVAPSHGPSSSGLSNPKPQLLGDNMKAKDAIEIYGWSTLKDDVQDMLTRKRIQCLKRDYKLIDDEYKKKITAQIDGDPDEAASLLIEYFEKNHEGKDLLIFCEFLRGEEKKAGRSAKLTHFAAKLQKVVETGEA